MNDDKRINDIADMMRNAEVPENLRESNLSAIREAIDEQKAGNSWWAKKMKISRLAAACFIAVFILQLLGNAYFLKNYKSDAAMVAETNKSKTAGQQISDDEPVICQSSVYLAGVGIVSKTINCVENYNETE